MIRNNYYQAGARRQQANTTLREGARVLFDGRWDATVRYVMPSGRAELTTANIVTDGGFTFSGISALRLRVVG